MKGRTPPPRQRQPLTITTPEAFKQFVQEVTQQGSQCAMRVQHEDGCPAQRTDSADDCRCSPTVQALAFGAADGQMTTDRLWFEQHPGQNVYYRDALADELLLGEPLVLPPDWCVRVEQITPGVRSRTVVPRATKAGAG